MAESDVVAIEPRPSTIINAFGGDNGGLIHKADARLGDFADFFEQMGEVAGVLEEAGLSSDKVRAKVREMLKTKKGHEAHIAALADLRDTYKCTLDKTDFRKVLEDKAKAKASQMPDDPNGVMREFEQKVEEGKRKAPGAGGDEDEDIVMTGAQATTNSRCPITSKPIADIEEPVQDQKGYVYERRAIEQYIRSKRGAPVPCPQSGTSHALTLADLKPAKAVVRMRKRAKLMENRTAAGVDDAADLLSP